jgi:hypothetical protein
MEPLNLFYEEPENDRWLKYDRYPRRIVRRIYRGKPVPSGQFLVFYNLIAGLKKLNISYRLNDYRYCKAHPAEIACVIGRDQVLDKTDWKNPIIFGAAFGINPVAHPDILKKYPIKKLLVPGTWVKEFFSPYGDENVIVWPVGIDTDRWKPSVGSKTTDVLIYNKIRWDQAVLENTLVGPVKEQLTARGLSYKEIKYGHYKPEALEKLIAECKFGIFLCEHETQGIAYQQMLAGGLPLLAWDRGGFWQDPSWYPHTIQFKPVTSVPYWDERCGLKFQSFAGFGAQLDNFLSLNDENRFDPRAYILENLTLAACAANYVQVVKALKQDLG